MALDKLIILKILMAVDIQVYPPHAIETSLSHPHPHVLRDQPHLLFHHERTATFEKVTQSNLTPEKTSKLQNVVAKVI